MPASQTAEGLVNDVGVNVLRKAVDCEGCPSNRFIVIKLWLSMFVKRRKNDNDHVLRVIKFDFRTNIY